MKPLLVEVIAYAPTQYYHCAHCEVLWKETGASNVQKWHDEMLKTSPQFQDGYASTRLEILFGQKKNAEARQFAESFSDTHLKNAFQQNALAWVFATQPGLEKNDLALAEKIAVRANEAAQGKEAPVLDTLARIQFMNGKKTEAIATEQKAVDSAPDEEKNFYKKFLTNYQQGKLPEINQ